MLMRQKISETKAELLILTVSILTVLAILLFLFFQPVKAETTPNDFYIFGMPQEYTKSIGKITFKNGKTDASIKDDSVTLEIKESNPDATNLLSKSFKVGDELDLREYIKSSGKYTLKVTGFWNNDSTKKEEEEPFEKTYEFTYDTSAPTITVSGIKNGALLNQDVKISINTKDDYALDSDSEIVTLKRNSEKEKDVTKDIVDKTLSVSDEGEYVLHYTFKDKAGNKAEDTIRFEIDKTAPKIAISSDKTDGYVQKISDITASMEDKNADEISISATSGNKTISNVSQDKLVSFKDSEGEYTAESEKWNVTVTAKDKAGNITKTVYPVIKDNVSPEVSFSGAEDNAYYSKDVSVQFNATDSALKTKSMKATLIPAGTNKKEEVSGNDFSKEGKYIITGEAEDKAGNKSEKQISFTIDKTAPEITFSGLKKNTHYIDPEKLSIEANEESSMTVEVRRDGSVIDAKKVGNKTSLTDWSKDGDYVITAEATDLAGNVSKKSEFSFTKDSTKPKLSISGVKEGKFYNESQTVSFASVERYYKTNNVKVSIIRNLNGKESEIPFKFQSVSEDTTHTFKASREGTYTIKISATDEAGNEATPREVSFTIDKTPPKTRISGANKGTHYRTSPSLKIEANEPGDVYVTIKRDGKKVRTIKGRTNLETSSFGKDGDYVVTAYTIDRAKNKGKVTSLSFVKDSTAPKISLSGADQNKYYKTAKNITIAVTERYYKSDKVSITGYRKLREKKVSIGKHFSGSGVHAKDVFKASETGTYYLEVSAKDKAGNIAQKKTIQFTVDTKKPIIKISIPKKENGYNDSITPSIQIDDDYFKTKSIVLTRTNGTKTGDVNLLHSDKFGNTGGKRTYSNFEKIKANDGAYTLKVNVSDKAGNTSTKTESFIVDRFGSIFKIKNVPDDYYMKSMDEDIEIEEINVSKISSYKAEIRQDGELISDAKVRTNKTGNHTLYSIDKSNFDEDGIYTVNLVTKDKAGNTSESKKAKNGKIKFAIDNAAPTINYSGLESGQLVKKKVAKLSVSANDTTSRANVSVTINGEDVPVKDGEVTLHEGYNQTVVITATDKAGNTATKKLRSISVSDSPFAKLVANKILMGLCIAEVIIVIGGIVLIVRKKKKHTSENEDKDEIVF